MSYQVLSATIAMPQSEAQVLLNLTTIVNKKVTSSMIQSAIQTATHDISVDKAISDFLSLAAD